VSSLCRICIPNTFRDYYLYDSGDLKPPIGGRVLISFARRKKTVGVVVGFDSLENPSFEIKPIESLLDEKPILPLATLHLCQWVSQYYQVPLSEVLALAIPKKLRVGAVNQFPEAQVLRLLMAPDQANSLISRSKKKQLVVELLLNPQEFITKESLKNYGITNAIIQDLIAKQIVSWEIYSPLPSSIPNIHKLNLNDEQQQALQTISHSLHAYHCFFLYGVTGSGKTEVYFEVIAKVLKSQKQVLFLVPEIGLTPQLVARFKARFNEPIAIIHSNLNDSERLKAWQEISENRVKILVGTRSAIFTPLPDLGLIIIDEEHDSSYKQMEGVYYSGRDAALMMAFQNNIPIILGTATPSLETLHNAEQKYTLLRLNKMAVAKHKPYYRIIDLRNQQLRENFAPVTVHTIKKHLEAGQQVLVFINRRGYSPVILCHHCGWIAHCTACDAALTWHRDKQKLICHHCGFMTNWPKQCKSCTGTELIPLGTGTQRVYDFLKTTFPAFNILRVDRDNVRKKMHYMNIWIR
jgi:primosomal protein N' (replication factor Y)